MIESDPPFDYRTISGLLSMNRNTIRRVFQLKDWQVRKCAVGERPRIEAKKSAVDEAYEACSTDPLPRLGRR